MITEYALMETMIIKLAILSMSFFICLLLVNWVEADLFNNLYPKFGDIPLLNRKVFGARRVTIHEHPYIASVRWKIAHYIPATILSKNTLITTAWPLNNVPINELFVITGQSYTDRGTKQRPVLFVVIHIHFDQETLMNDLALLRVYEDFQFGFTVKPIMLWNDDDTKLNATNAFVTGWGRCDFTGSEMCLKRSTTFYRGEIMDNMLRTVTFKLNMPEIYCEVYRKHGVKLYEGMLCVGTAREQDSVAPCLAVPGAPLVVGGALLGVLSWGLGCGYTHDLPLVYTNLRHYIKWIVKTVHILTNNLDNSQLNEVAEVHKAFNFIDIMSQTRFLKLDDNLQTQIEIMPLSLDNILSKLDARVYDIRDYIDNHKYSERKQSYYKKLKKIPLDQILKNMTELEDSQNIHEEESDENNNDQDIINFG